MKLCSLVLATVVKTKNLNIKLGFRILSMQGEFQMLHLFLFVLTRHIYYTRFKSSHYVATKIKPSIIQH